MNLMDLFVKISVDDQASSKISNITSAIGRGLSSAASLGTSAVSGTAKVIGSTLANAAKVGATAIGLVSTAVIKLGTDAVKSYAEYEQLVGGVETLFKDSAGVVQNYADQAYKTAGLSANEYMSTVTSFSASLLQSFGDHAEVMSEETADALKDSLDDQVEAFEKATDQKIALINKEYTESIKLIDEERYNRIKAIDEQIDALNAQTEAEREALEEQEQNRRKAELLSRIATAETYDEKIKAEQDYQQYVAKLEQEAREKSRKAQIEELKDQKELIKEETDARKEALKEQYDEELSAYKESRQEQLEVLKDSVSKQKDLITDMIGQTTASMEKTSEAYQQAAEYANMAVVDMSDNANKMG